MTHDATTGASYSYDQENRITGAAGYTYTYDADGNRVEKSNGSTGTIYWYMAPGIVAESDLTGALKSEYIFFDGERVARKDFSGSTTAISYYFSDHLKTAAVITDSAGIIKEDEELLPLGWRASVRQQRFQSLQAHGKRAGCRDRLGLFRCPLLWELARAIHYAGLVLYTCSSPVRRLRRSAISSVAKRRALF